MNPGHAHNTSRTPGPNGGGLSPSTGALSFFALTGEQMFTCAERRAVHLREANIDPGRLLDFHDVMLSHAQDDERARKAWKASNAEDVRRRREELRLAWAEHHSCMQALH